MTLDQFSLFAVKICRISYVNLYGLFMNDRSCIITQDSTITNNIYLISSSLLLYYCSNR